MKKVIGCFLFLMIAFNGYANEGDKIYGGLSRAFNGLIIIGSIIIVTLIILDRYFLKRHKQKQLENHKER